MPLSQATGLSLLTNGALPLVGDRLQECVPNRPAAAPNGDGSSPATHSQTTCLSTSPFHSLAIPKASSIASSPTSSSSLAYVPLSSALLSQMPMLLEDREHDPSLFPTGFHDINGQQVRHVGSIICFISLWFLVGGVFILVRFAMMGSR